MENAFVRRQHVNPSHSCVVGRTHPTRRRQKAIVQPGSNDPAVSTRLITAPRCANNRRAAIAKSGVPPRHHATDSNVRVARDPMQLQNERCTRRASFHDRVACSSRERKILIQNEVRIHLPSHHPSSFIRRFFIRINVPFHLPSPRDPKSIRRFPFFRAASRYKMRNATFHVPSLFKQKSKGKKNCSQGERRHPGRRRKRERENEL